MDNETIITVTEHLCSAAVWCTFWYSLLGGAARVYVNNK